MCLCTFRTKIRENRQKTKFIATKVLFCLLYLENEALFFENNGRGVALVLVP